MALITLLKANIKHRKGTFISIAFLMLLVTMAITTIISVSDNYSNSFDEAFSQADSPSVVVFSDSSYLDDKVFEDVRNHKDVSRIKIIPTVTSTKTVIGDSETKTTWIMQKLRDNYLVMNDAMNGYKSETPKLKSGEIYIPLGVKTNMPCEIGDKITISTIAKDYEFKIAGFVAEPLNGSSFIGWKQVFISDYDFERLSADIIAIPSPEPVPESYAIYIYKTTDCELSDYEFRRTVNLDTGIIDRSMGSLTREMSKNYSTLMPTIIIGVLTVFVFILFAVVVIVMNNSITTSIEMDYVNLGILKSQGFTPARLRFIVGSQYILSQLIGSVIGVFCAIPLNNFLSGIFQPIIAIICSNKIALLKSILFIIGILAISVLFIFVATRKISRITPVRALCGGRESIYFDSRLKLAISKKGLSTSLALRQLTSNKRQYIGVISIVSILVFFMITIMSLGNILSADSAMEAMGQISSDVNVIAVSDIDNDKLEDIENTIKKHSNIEQKHYYSFTYASINGDHIACISFDKADMIAGMLKGRTPNYDNEVSVSELLAKALDLNIGDKVTISNNDKKDEYIISGFHQNLTDAGLNFILCDNGAKKLGLSTLKQFDYSLTETDKAKTVIEELNDKYSDIINATANDGSQGTDAILDIAIVAVKAIIYSLSIIFAFVVVLMTCQKAFSQERMDIGIYKAVGFTSANLRIQFALRFLILSLIGSVIGSLLCLAFTKNLISVVLELIGISSFKVLFDFNSIFTPVSLICICFFIFSYLVSAKIKKVSAKELVIK